MAGPNFGWANFFHNMAGPKFGWANYGWATFLAGPIFSTFWLGQSLAAGPVLAGPSGWANFAGKVLWLGHFGWANGWVIDWPSQKFGPAIIGPAKFFFTLAGPIMAQPKIWPSHNWPSQFFLNFGWAIL